VAVLAAVCAWPAATQAQTVINDMVIMPSECTTCLPKTGQEVCYNATNQTVSCSDSARYGQDALYSDPAGSYDYGCTRGEGSWANWNADGHRFTNNGDGTVTDHATGLMWVANSTAAGRGETYNWANALNASENLTYAGHDDWHLPNVRELQSIVDYGTYNPAIDTNFFVAQSSFYWPSTTNANNPTNAWNVNFNNGKNGDRLLFLG
jgi:hypothetical protein